MDRGVRRALLLACRLFPAPGAACFFGVPPGPSRSPGAIPDLIGMMASQRFLSFGNPYERGATRVPGDPVVRVTLAAGWRIRPR